MGRTNAVRRRHLIIIGKRVFFATMGARVARWEGVKKQRHAAKRPCAKVGPPVRNVFYRYTRTVLAIRKRLARVSDEEIYIRIEISSQPRQINHRRHPPSPSHTHTHTITVPSHCPSLHPSTRKPLLFPRKRHPFFSRTTSHCSSRESPKKINNNNLLINDCLVQRPGIDDPCPSPVSARDVGCFTVYYCPGRI